ncbi:MAG: hypothetical protein ACLUI7_03170 [Coprococcus sp.]
MRISQAPRVKLLKDEEASVCGAGETKDGEVVIKAQKVILYRRFAER